ncbi:MAG: nicotinate phosphoribosyltransferase [Legionella sp.]|uniref:nicotinate phosphoribosyltransferase n=1 Tax=Legionella sp. TaxID=459 RepID=UPI0039E3FDCA
MFDFTGSYTDQYQLAMAEVYFLKGQKDHQAIFDYFFRKLPFDSGYAVFAGLADLLALLEHFQFDAQDIEFLRSQGLNPEFLTYLENFRFQGTIYAVSEGDLIFPDSPILSVEANIIEAQLIETILLNLLNFQSLIATKASKIRQVAGECTLVDFGLRRAQGPGGYYASRAAIIGGFNATSNVRAGRDFHIPIAGTMAHSFIQSYDDELSAFRDFAQVWPDNCTLLVDTYNTLESGIPNAIIIGRELEQQGHRLQAIRLDSGDLYYLARKARQMLDDASLAYVKIIASNQLDEHSIKILCDQKAPIDIFGVGTNLVVGAPDAALDGIYKLVLSQGKPRLKLSENRNKITLPYQKQNYRLLTAEGNFFGADVIALKDEPPPEIMYAPFTATQTTAIKNYKKEPLLHKVMEQGTRLHPPQTLQEITNYHKERLLKLSLGHKKFHDPVRYEIGISSTLKTNWEQLIKEHQ